MSRLGQNDSQQQEHHHHPVVDIEELHHNVRKKKMASSNNSMTSSKKDIRELLSNVDNVVALCTCQQSKDFPYCDNTHAIFNKATNSNLSPLYVAFVEGGNCNECGAKRKGISRSSQLPKSSSTSLSSSSSLSSSLSSLPSTLDSSATTTTGCSITLSDCTNTDSSFLDSTIIPSSLSSSQQRGSRKSLRKSSERSLSSSCQCTTHTPKPTTPTPSTSTDTPIDNDTITLIDTTDTTTTTPTSPSTTTLPPSTLPSTTTHDKDVSPVIIPPVQPDTLHNNAKDITNRVTFTPTSIKDTRNRNNIITRDEVAHHNNQHDLWMIIQGNVYDITQYISSHPGGVRALVKFAGKDGTENVQYHSSAMLEILNSRYYIGKLPREEGGPGGGCIIS